MDRPERALAQGFTVEDLSRALQLPPSCRRIALTDGSVGLAAVPALAHTLGADGAVWQYDDRYRHPALTAQTLVLLDQPGDDTEEGIVAATAAAVQTRLDAGHSVFLLTPAAGWSSAQRALLHHRLQGPGAGAPVPIAADDGRAEDAFCDHTFTAGSSSALLITDDVQTAWRTGADFPDCVTVLALPTLAAVPHPIDLRQALGRAHEVVVVGPPAVCLSAQSCLAGPFVWQKAHALGA